MRGCAAERGHGGNAHKMAPALFGKIPVSGVGQSGKTADVANLQDLLVYKLRELSQLVIQSGLKDEKIDVVYTLSKNEFNGKTYVDLIIKDWKKSSSN